jgi:membrane protease YdiL (CAAX protease family)
MTQQGNIRPMRFWQSLLFFMIPGLCAVVAQYVIFPAMVQLGISEENAYNTTHLAVFIGLIFATIVALQIEGWPLRWSSIKERLRLKPMDSTAWKWTIPFMVLYLLLGFLLNLLAQFVYEQLGFWPPDADLPLTNIPYLLIVFIFNIISEELWWRGYILPRQELEHGRSAWIVNGLLWSLFHIWKWWSVPFLILKQWMLPLVVQRTKNTTPGIMIHFVSNGAGIFLSILPLLTS